MCIGIPYIIVLLLIAFCRYYISSSFFFYTLKVCGNPELSKSMSAIFPVAFCLFLVSVSHFGNSHHVSNLHISEKIMTC